MGLNSLRQSAADSTMMGCVLRETDEEVGYVVA